MQVPWKGRVRMSPEADAPRLRERQNQPRGRVAGAAVNHSSQRKGDCLGSRKTAGCSEESWVLQEPEVSCLIRFLRKCGSYNLPSKPKFSFMPCPQSAGALLEQGSQRAGSGAKELGKHLRPEK